VYSTSVAYFLWFISGFGALGLHRFYIGKFGSGLLYLFSGGLFMVGGVFDFFNLPDMVREANLQYRYRELLEERMLHESRDFHPQKKAKESLERVILRTAKENNGMVTPAIVALEGDIPLEDAQKALEKLASKGFIEMRVRKTGQIVYCFLEFMNKDVKDFEDI